MITETTKWHPDYTTAFLDWLWGNNKNLYQKAMEACNSVGNDMVTYIFLNYRPLYDEIHPLAVEGIAEITLEKRGL